MKYLRLPAFIATGGLALLLAAFRPTADDGFVQQLAQQLTRFYTTTYPEKTYLHLDKQTYAAGETLWFKAYLVDAVRHRPDTLSRVLYVDLLTPENKVLEQHVLQLRQGTAPGDFQLPDTLAQGTYTVRAYTSWMRNTGPEYFFTRPVAVLAADRKARRLPPAPAPPANQLDLQFFPEGGQLVAGLESTVGLKATDPYGHGVAVSGEVQDVRGATVASFSSRHLGMGRFQFKPEAGQQYQVILRQPSTQRGVYPLPAVQPAGFTMRVLEIGSFFQVAVQRKSAGSAAAPERITVVAQVRGQLAYAGQAEMSDANTFVTRIPKDKFGAGVAHFTLFDGQNRARCERLAFVDNDPGLRLTLQPDKASYAPREKVTVRITATDAAGQPAAGEFSLAVNNTTLAPFDSGATDIRTHLLLASDLRGRVEAPGYYFANRRPATVQALDNLLLTQGWRRFVWQDLLAGRFGSFPYPLEYTLGVSGQVLGNKKLPAPNAQVTLFRLGGEKDLALATTDSAGRFLFGGFDGRDTARLLVRVKPTKGMRSPIIRLDRFMPEVVTLPVRPLSPSSEVQEAYLRSSRRQQAVERQYQPDGKSILLGNVTVSGQRPVLKPDSRRIYNNADAVIRPQDIPAAGSYVSVLQLLQGRVAGVYISGPPGDMHAQIRGQTSMSGSSEPLYLLDGIPVDASVTNTISVQDVESVEVLKGLRAAVFGSRASGGVISILTKQGGPDYDHRQDPADHGLLTYALPKFQAAREFYMPAYGRAGAPPTDYRSATLYWNPNVRTDAAGQASVSFYASDEGGPFRLTLEGLSAVGTAGRGTGQLTVRR